MIISMIAAMGKSRQLGIKGEIPWYIPEDFKHFKKVTMGHHLIMGRKTFESIGKPLPGRTTIILSRDQKYHRASQIPVANDKQTALAMALDKQEEEVFICGGGEVYNLYMPEADRLYLSFVDYDGEADAFFPAWDKTKFILVKSKAYPAFEKFPAWKFELWEKQS